MSPTKVFVRLTAFDRIVPEIERIYEFYRLNPSDFVRDRDPRELISNLKNGYGFKIEDEERRLHGVSFMFDRGGGRDIELGGTRITLNGFGLQKTLLACRIALAQSYHLFERYCFTIVNQLNDKSTGNVSHSGLPVRNDIYNSLADYGVADPAQSGKSLFALHRDDLHDGTPAAEQFRKELLQLHASPTVTGKGGGKLDVILDFELIRSSVLRKGLFGTH